MKYLAQTIKINGQSIQGPLDGIDTISDIINNVLPFIISIAAIILFFVLVWGGYDYILSQGRPEKVKAGKAKITTGLIGFGLLILSFLMVRVIAVVFGLGGGLF
ncbi:MAG: hypothetical protein AAB966_02365 [Patescibacteria group bacterium]